MSRLLDLFHSQGRGRPVGGGDVIQWLLRDDFNDTLAAGSVNGTDATPGPGTRTVVDTGNHLSIGSGLLSVDGNAAAGDPHFDLGAIARVAGQLLVGNNTSSTLTSSQIGWDVNQLGGTPDAHCFQLSATNLYVRNDGGPSLSVGAVVNTTVYYYAMVLRDTVGAYFFMKGGVFTNWTLLWVDDTGGDTPLYPTIAIVTNVAITYNFLRVPEETWLPTPLAYDTFTDGNGTSLDAHASDTSGPDSQLVVSRAWTEQSGDWDIQNNLAECDVTASSIATIPSTDADAMIDADVYAVNVNANAMGLMARYTDTSNYWRIYAKYNTQFLIIEEVNAGGVTERASTAITFSTATTYAVRAILDGQTIDGFWDGANKISYGSAALNETVAVHGMYSSAGLDNVHRYNNFLVFARDDGYSALDKYIA